MVAFFVVCTIALFLGIDAVVQLVERRRGTSPALAPSIQPVAAGRSLWQRAVPAGVFLDSGHGSTTIEPSGHLHVGVDQLVLAAIGSIDRIETLPIGTSVKRGQPLLRLHRGADLLEVTAPASGKIRGWNESVLQSPALAFERLYAPDGWMIEIEPDRLDEEISLWKIAKETARWMSTELGRLRLLAAEGVFSAVPALADGGNPIEGFLSESTQGGWDRFNSEFLRSRPREDDLTAADQASISSEVPTSPRSPRR